MERIKAILRKEFIQIFRDKRMIALLLFIPVFQTIIFGIVVTTDIKNINTAIIDLNNTDTSRRLTQNISSSKYFNIIHKSQNVTSIDSLIDNGKIKCAFIIKEDFSNNIKQGKSGDIQIIIDGTDSNTASIILKYINSIIDIFSQNTIRERTSTHSIAKVAFQHRSFYNNNLSSRFFYVPGVVALIITIIITLLSSMSIVKEKEAGTIDQIMVSPIRKYEFILGKTLPFAIIGYVDVILTSTFARIVFDIPFKGSFINLMIAATFYLISMLSIGLIISTISNTQQEAMMTSFFFIFPAMLLSGFIFPIFNMPKIIAFFTLFNPLRYFLIIIRSIFLKGSTINELLPEYSALIILSTVLLYTAVNKFKKNL